MRNARDLILLILAILFIAESPARATTLHETKGGQAVTAGHSAPAFELEKVELPEQVIAKFDNRSAELAVDRKNVYRLSTNGRSTLIVFRHLERSKPSSFPGTFELIAIEPKVLKDSSQKIDIAYHYGRPQILGVEIWPGEQHQTSKLLVLARIEDRASIRTKASPRDSRKGRTSVNRAKGGDGTARGFVFDIAPDLTLTRHLANWEFAKTEFTNIRMLSERLSRTLARTPCLDVPIAGEHPSDRLTRISAAELSLAMRCFLDRDDKFGFARQFSFPLRYVSDDGQVEDVASADGFVKAFDRIITDGVRKTLVEDGAFDQSNYHGVRVGRQGLYYNHGTFTRLFNPTAAARDGFKRKLTSTNAFVWQALPAPRKVHKDDDGLPMLCRTKTSLYRIFDDKLLIWKNRDADPANTPPDDLLFGLFTSYGTCGAFDWTFFDGPVDVTASEGCFDDWSVSRELWGERGTERELESEECVPVGRVP